MSAQDGKQPPTGDRSVQEIGGKPPKADWRRYARFTVWGVVAVYVALLLLQNSQQTTVNFVFFSIEVPLFVALALMLVLGLALGSSLVWFMQRRKAKQGAHSTGPAGKK